MLTATTTRHANSTEVHQEINDRLSGLASGTPVTDAAALAVASWYQCPRTGRAFAQLASTGTVDSDALLADIATATSETTDPASLRELMALFGWATSRTV